MVVLLVEMKKMKKTNWKENDEEKERKTPKPTIKKKLDRTSNKK
jgi:hypothetical protein